MASAGFDPTALLASGYAAMQQQHMHSMQQHTHHAAASSHHGGGGGGSSKKDQAGKARKPYTITKPRESWSKEEHQLFIDALALYERDWKRIHQHIGTKSIIQIRSHAQKYFIKLAKSGMKEYIPAPARPKRAAPSGKKSSGRSKRQRIGGEDEDDDGLGEEEDDGEGDGGEESDGNGEDEEGDAHMGATAVPASPNSKAAARLHGLAAAMAGEGGSARKRSAPKPGGGPARKMPPPSSLRRGGSVDDGAEGTRRSGRKRVQKRKFEDEEYGSDVDVDAEGDEQDDEQDDAHDELAHAHHAAAAAAATHRRRGGMAGKVAPSRMQQHSYDEQAGAADDDDEYGEAGDGDDPDGDDGGGDTAHSGTASRHSNPSSQPASSPSTPLRKSDTGTHLGGGAHPMAGGAMAGRSGPGGMAPSHGGLNQLSQLSPLSQLSQATELDLGPHLLPASGYPYNPKLKPYPGLHMQRSTHLGMGGGLGPPPLHAPATRMHGGIPLAHHAQRADHTSAAAAAAAAHAHASGHHSSLAVNTEGHDAAGGVGNVSMVDSGGSSSAEAAAAAPELAKVYSFLGSLFDPSTSGHVEELDKMTPVNKEIVQKLMQNLATNLSGSPTQSASGSLGNDALLGGVGSVASRLLGAPKHMRTSSLGSIGSMGSGVGGGGVGGVGGGMNDALSPDMSHRWLASGGPEPSVSPVPTHAGSNSVLASLTGPPLVGSSGNTQGPGGAHGSPTGSGSFLPRSFSSEGLTVSVIPPGALSSAAAAGLGGSGGPPGSGSSGSNAWSSDKSRPGFASSALVSRITARGGLSPLSVNPLANGVVGSGVGYAASSPTGMGGRTLGDGGVGGGGGGNSLQLGLAAYGSYAMSPVGGVSGAGLGTPMSFSGSPGGFFSPHVSAHSAAASTSAAAASSTVAAAAAHAGTSHPAIAATHGAHTEHHQYPAVSHTLNLPTAATARPTSASPSAHTATAVAASPALTTQPASASPTSAASPAPASASPAPLPAPAATT